MPTTEKRQLERIPKIKSFAKTSFQNACFYEEAKRQLTVTVAVSPAIVYSFFRDFENFPLFMKDLKSVEVVSQKSSHWTVKAKGLIAEWDAEITEERPGEMISWKSVDGSEIETSGSLWFSPAPEILGTTITFILDYKVPGGNLTDLFTIMSEVDPKPLAFINLRRLKC